MKKSITATRALIIIPTATAANAIFALLRFSDRP
jgi:hypothetical protein